MEIEFSDKIVLVTGAASGIGLETARMFAEEGATVIVNDLNEDVASTAAESISKVGTAYPLAFDISNQSAVDSAVAQAVDRFGRIDVLVNNAGVTGRGPAVSNQKYEHVLAVNLAGPFYCARAVAEKSMIPNQSGSIVNLSSLAGLAAIPDDVGYSTSKHGVIGLTKALAIEWAKYGITVNAVCPGITDSAMVQAVAEKNPDFLPRRFARIPRGAPAQPEDHAKAILFFASDLARYVTGAILPVDGGQMALNSGHTI